MMSEAGRERERRVQIMRPLGETARPTDGRIDDHLNIGRSLQRRTMIGGLLSCRPHFRILSDKGHSSVFKNGSPDGR